MENKIPIHIGLILDGNRRWAKANKLTSLEGHRRGSEVFKQVSMHYFDRGVKYLSAFVFSGENWKRTTEEVSYLMKLVIRAVEKYLDEFNSRGIKIIIAGERGNLADDVLKAIKKTETKTKNNQKATLALFFNYSGHQEIVQACQKINDLKLPNTDVDDKLIEQNLYAPSLPPLDLLVRTSGEKRTSGFMMWQAAYAELLFFDIMWPDFGEQEVDYSLQEYAKRQRRFGS